MALAYFADLRTRAITAATDRLRAARSSARFAESPAGYLVDWTDNLVDGVAPDLFEADLRRGAGCELDAQTRTSVLAIESKFLEPLTTKPAEFSAQYQNALGSAEAPWRNLYQRLCSDPRTYRYLDAAQLVKHYLGLWHSFRGFHRTLFLLYWEPSNASLEPRGIHDRS